MTARSESILFLVVGLIAAINGAYRLLYGNYQESSGWVVIMNGILLTVGINEEVTATTWVGEPTRVSWERLTEIWRGEDLLVKARSVWCLIDRMTLKPTRITKDLKELFSDEINS